MERKIIISVLLASMLVLVGCETSKGIGKDVENTGKNIQNAAEHND